MPYFPGDYKVICDRCGFQFLRSETEFDGSRGKEQLLVCIPCRDPRHPQDRPIHGKGERQRVANPRPEQEDTFIDVTFS